MPSGACEECGQIEYMPFVCKFCHKKFCTTHRLPENHSCEGLGEARMRWRREGRLIAPEARGETREWRRERPLPLGRWMRNLQGKSSLVLLALMGLVFLVQVFLASLGRAELIDRLFVLDDKLLLHPWVVVTSIFAHANLSHLLFNALVLFFFGPALESIVGTRKFLGIFLGAGIVAGLGQLLFDIALRSVGVLPPSGVGILGASGGLMGVLGALTILTPRLPILLFFILPVPLWFVTALYAFLDLVGLASPQSSIANVAHLVGLALGLYVGSQFKRARMRSLTYGAPVGWGR